VAQRHTIEQLSTVNDAELVLGAQQGDDQAFAELFSRHRARCLRLGVSILHNMQDAEDEVQNAFWRAYQHLDRFQGKAKFSTWVNRILINQCVMHIRNSRRRRSVYIGEIAANDDRSAWELRDKRRNPEEELDRNEVENWIRKEVRGIPPLLQPVLVLRDFEQRSTTDVAALMRISAAAVKSRLLRARRILRLRMRRHTGRIGMATHVTENWLPPITRNRAGAGLHAPRDAS
jgi:RNA polymerase sigma-70 factor (ECF subfamily)